MTFLTALAFVALGMLIAVAFGFTIFARIVGAAVDTLLLAERAEHSLALWREHNSGWQEGYESGIKRGASIVGADPPIDGEIDV